MSEPLPNPKSAPSKAKRRRHEADGFTRDFAQPEFLTTFLEIAASSPSVAQKLDPVALKEQIENACDAVNKGDLRGLERMALSQAHSLNYLYTRLMDLAFENLGTPHGETFLRLALRAQSQSARTLETLATLKGPTVFARQLNVANQQVVRNGDAGPPEIEGPSATLLPSPPIVCLAEKPNHACA